MAFVFATVNPTKPGNVAHFWDVTCDDADTQSDWIANGFQETPQEYTIFDVLGFAKTYTGFYRVELNTVPVTARIPSYVYINDEGYPITVPERLVDVVAGRAFRVVKTAAVTSGGPTRVKVAYYPGDLG